MKSQPVGTDLLTGRPIDRHSGDIDTEQTVRFHAVDRLSKRLAFAAVPFILTGATWVRTVETRFAKREEVEKKDDEFRADVKTRFNRLEDKLDKVIDSTIALARSWPVTIPAIINPRKSSLAIQAAMPTDPIGQHSFCSTTSAAARATRSSTQ